MAANIYNVMTWDQAVQQFEGVILAVRELVTIPIVRLGNRL